VIGSPQTQPIIKGFPETLSYFEVGFQVVNVIDFPSFYGILKQKLVLGIFDVV
jgi:hypothetical protein